MAEVLKPTSVKGFSLPDVFKAMPKVKLGVPLVPTHSEYDKLLVQDNAEVGGGPMGEEYSLDERNKTLDDGENGVADEGLAESIVSKIFTTSGLVVCVLLVTALLCLGAARGVYGGGDSSLATRVSEFMFSGAGQQDRDESSSSSSSSGAEHNVKKSRGEGADGGKESPALGVDDKYAARPAVMPHDDDGRAQLAFDRADAYDFDDEEDDEEEEGEGGGGRRSKMGKGPRRRGAVASLGRRRAAVSSSRSESGGAGGGRGDRRRHKKKASEEDEDEDDFPAISAGQVALGERDGGGGEGDEGEEYARDSAAVERTRMELGATHQKALEQLEASIRDTVKAAHESRRHGLGN